MALMAAPASAAVISVTNNTPGNFDASSGTRIFTIGSSGQVLDVDIEINFAKADGQDFDGPYPGGTPFYNEIVFLLESPTGTQMTLIAANSWGAGSGQFDGTIRFDDSALQVVNFGAAPVAGTFQPTGPGLLGVFNGENALGDWTLTIQDTVGADSLRFRFATLDVTVPEPATLLLLGTAIVGVMRRRFSA